MLFSFSSYPYSSESKLCDFEMVYVYKKNYVAPNKDRVLIKSQPGVVSASPKKRTFAGTWESRTFGKLTIGLSGDVLSGKYTYKNGEIRGKVVGDKFVGRWNEVDSAGKRKSGPVEFVLSKDGNSIDGRFGYNFNPLSKRWILKRIK